VTTKQAELAGYRAQGFRVVLDLGLHYPPDWVRAIDEGALFQNQFGDRYTSSTVGKNTVNTVFDQAVRNAVGAYTDQVFRDFGTDFDAVRVGGGGNGELSYPQGGYQGHVAPLWAYDPVAQGTAAGLADGLTPNPVPGWRPGGPDPGHVKAGLLLHWYVSALADWQNWQIARCRSAGFRGSFYVMLGAYGMREGKVSEVANAIASGLQNCAACDRQTLSSGQDWAGIIAAMPPDPMVYPYTTWADGPDDANDASDDPAAWSPAKYLATTARRTGRMIGGENSGDADPARLKRAFAHLREHQLVVLYWYSEPQLFGGSFVVIQDLRTEIAAAKR
jgi:hypothetical protein